MIISQPLSVKEKQLLKKVLKIRLFFGAFFILPLILIIFIILGYSIYQFLISDYDEMTFFSLAFTIIAIFIFFKYTIPFFRRTYKNLEEKNKLVVRTQVLDIEIRTTGKGNRYIITTPYKIFDTWSISIIDNQPPFLFYQVYIGMLLEIHALENNNIDILKIKKV